MKSGKSKPCRVYGIIRTRNNTDVVSTGYFRSKCKQCFKVACKDYEKTLNGYLVRVYRNMKSRVTGIQAKKAHLYNGKSILPKETFYQFSLNDNNYLTLHKAWADSGYTNKLAPSIDRRDSSIGYDLDNIRWITHSENSKRGAISRHHGIRGE